MEALLLVPFLWLATSPDNLRPLGPLSATVSVQGRELVVTFPESNPSGLVTGQRIVGVGDELFDRSFQEGVGAKAHEGPLVELGDALIAAWKGDGQLTLQLQAQEGRDDLVLDVGQAPEFGDTFPEESPWADATIRGLAEWLTRHAAESRSDARALAGLALLATGNEADREAARALADAVALSPATDLEAIFLLEATFALENDALVRDIEVAAPATLTALPTEKLALSLIGRGLLRDRGVEAATRGLYRLRTELRDRTDEVGRVSSDHVDDLGPTALSILAIAVTSDPDELIVDHQYVNRGAQFLADFPFGVTSSRTFFAHFLATASTDPAALRHIADVHRWWFALAVAGDGGTVGRRSESFSTGRTQATAELLLALAAPRAQLRLLGKPLDSF